MKMVRVKLNEIDPKLSEEEQKELKAAEEKPVIFDADSPELSPEQLLQFKRANREGRVKQTASIRLSEKAQRFSKAYGKGYTSFLSRLIDAALDDEALVRKSL